MERRLAQGEAGTEHIIHTRSSRKTHTPAARMDHLREVKMGKKAKRKIALDWFQRWNGFSFTRYPKGNMADGWTLVLGLVVVDYSPNGFSGKRSLK